MKTESWAPYQFIVRRKDKEQSVFDVKGANINCPLRCSITVLSPKPEVTISDDKGETSEDRNVYNDYSGAGLTNAERKGILQLSCDTVIKNNKDFGPRYSSNMVNFLTKIAICPSDCFKIGESKIFGLGIHPEESSICKSAIIDRSMPLLGRSNRS